MAANKFFGTHRIITETELSFNCHDGHLDGEVRTWFSGVNWSFEKKRGERARLRCVDTWETGEQVLADVHFYCNPAEETKRPMSHCTFSLLTLTKGDCVEADDHLTFDGPASWGVYIRLLKAWDLPQDRYNNPASVADQHPLVFQIENIRFFINANLVGESLPVLKNWFEKEAVHPGQEVSIGFHLPTAFNVFLHAIDVSDPVLPAPDSLEALCEFSHIYKVRTLRERCQSHLKYCHELPLLRRLLMAVDYEMEDAVSYLCGLMTKASWNRAYQQEPEAYTMLCNSYPRFIVTLFERSFSE